MKTAFHIGLALAVVFLFTGCFSSIYDITFHESSEVVIVPADGGEYYFEVEAGAQTKTSYMDRLWNFEYRICIDGNIIDQQMGDISLSNRHIHEGDVFKVYFTVPSNDTSEQRDITVEILKARNDNHYIYHVDADDKDWQVVWRARQSGR